MLPVCQNCTFRVQRNSLRRISSIQKNCWNQLSKCFGNCDQRFSTRLLILLFTSSVELLSVFQFLRNVKERRLKTQTQLANFSLKNHVSVLRIFPTSCRSSENQLQDTQQLKEQTANVLKRLLEKFRRVSWEKNFSLLFSNSLRKAFILLAFFDQFVL